MDGWRGGQIAQDQTQGVIAPNLVVTIGDDDEDGKRSNPPAEEAEQLDCGPVGPMGVFADDDRRPRTGGERREHLPKEPIAGVAVERLLVNLYTESRRQVADRTERTGRRKCVARHPQEFRCAGDLAAEGLNQGGLAHPGLAADEHHAPVARGGLAQMLLELLQMGFSLDSSQPVIWL